MATRDELKKYFRDFNDLLKHLNTVADNMLTEYMERKLEYFIVVLFGMLSSYENNENNLKTNDVVVLLKQLDDFAYSKWNEVKEKIAAD